jgi:hypothetical protein
MFSIPFKRVLKWLFLFLAAREILGFSPSLPVIVSATLHSTTVVLLAKGAVGVLGTAFVWWLVLNGARGAVQKAHDAAKGSWCRFSRNAE